MSSSVNATSNTKRNELFDVLLDRRGHGADDEVSLNTNTIDGDALSLERLDEIVHCGGFGSAAFNVVVVDL